MVVNWRSRAFAAGRRGDPVGVLAATDGCSDPLALAVRAIALAQLDELRAARGHLQRAEREFVRQGRETEARCARLAEAEIAVWDLDLVHARRRLLALAHELRAEGDYANATWALVVAARAAHLQGDAEGAALLLERCRDEAGGRVPAHVEAVLAMAEGEHFARMLAAREARQAAWRARDAVRRAGNPTLAREISRFAEAIEAPIARLAQGRTLNLAEVADVLSEKSAIVVDACRARILVRGRPVLDLATRPALFELVGALARAAPGALSTSELIRSAFGARVPNPSYEARLRVELGRLRRALATELGQIVQERRTVRWDAPLRIVVLEPLVPRREARICAILADGRAWPVRTLSHVLGQSPRTVQRQLADMAGRGAISALGKGRSRRWTIGEATPRIASWILLPTPLSAE
jgi:hypothetical protein